MPSTTIILSLLLIVLISIAVLLTQVRRQKKRLDKNSAQVVEKWIQLETDLMDIRRDLKSLVGTENLNRENLKPLFVVIAIGQKYIERYFDLYFTSHQRYCDKWGYELRIVKYFIDPGESDRSLISLQKALVCRLETQELDRRVVFLDADILINVNNSPPIHEKFVDPHCAYFVDEYTQPSLKRRLEINKNQGWEVSAADYYKMAGFNIDTASVINTGLMSLVPRHHGNFMENIYAVGARDGRGHHRGFHYEQSLIGASFLRSNNYRFLDSKWNFLIGIALADKSILSKSEAAAEIERQFNSNYFLHFAGGVDKKHEDLVRSLGYK